MRHSEINTSHKFASNGLQGGAAREGGGTGVPVREVVQPAGFETIQCVGVASQRHFSEIHHDHFHVLSDFIVLSYKRDAFQEASIGLNTSYRD
jgi:hypothetical protein